MARAAVRVAGLLVCLVGMVSCAAPGAGKAKEVSRAVEAPAGGLAGALTAWSAARGGQSGIAVLEGNRVVGIISRRQVMQALNAQMKGCQPT